MKRATLALTIFSAIIILMLLLAQVTEVKANPFSFEPEKPGLFVYQPSSNHMYLMDGRLDILFYYAMKDNLTQFSFFYNLDNSGNFPLRANLESGYVYYYAVSNTLNNLADGDHTLTVYAHCSNGTVNPLFSTIITVDAAAYTPLIISPLNQTTYNTNQVPLTYSLNKEILWSYYSVDSTNNSDLKNFRGNITLPNLSEGQHKLTLAVTTNTTTIHQTIQTITFSINTTTSTPSVPEFAITAFLVAVLVAVSLSLYIGKKKLTLNHQRTVLECTCKQLNNIIN